MSVSRLTTGLGQKNYKADLGKLLVRNHAQVRDFQLEERCQIHLAFSHGENGGLIRPDVLLKVTSHYGCLLICPSPCHIALP